MLPEKPEVELVTTDGFLYSNAELEKRGLLHKGFPESYDAKRLLAFLAGAKSGREILEAPVYSHLYYDIIPGEVCRIRKPDILIIEGINALQVTLNTQPCRRVFVSDFSTIPSMSMPVKKISGNGILSDSRSCRPLLSLTPTHISISMPRTMKRL